MTPAVRFKVCGLTSAIDAQAAASCGAAFLGFIFYPKSPRFVSLDQFGAMAPELPRLERVAVTVEPDSGTLLALRGMGFTLFQVHFRHDLPLRRLEEWTHAVGANALWLAPKLPPEASLSKAWLSLANGFLLDTFDRQLYGGTGRTGDWTKFRQLSEGHDDKTWILSGGLTAENVGEALATTGTRCIDVSSGVESAPGIKDHARLKAFAEAVRAASAA
ncbi:MAG TPA: phosphoribosylanthranilate isomerase [Opitutaceae bacterium]|jgi:phosphoribosylanthranilate isomerase